MKRFELFVLIGSAVGACIASTALGWLNLALAGFGCFYMEPIGGAKCSHMPVDPFWTGFWDTLGHLSIPWTLTFIFFAADHHRRAQ